MRNPPPPRNMPRMPGQKMDWKAAKRLLSYITKQYKLRFALVLLCIILSTLAGVAGSLFLQVLIDDYFL